MSGEQAHQLNRRARRLHHQAEERIATLIALLASADETRLGRPCPGREKLADGTIRAVAPHTAANYQQIAAFVAGEASVGDGSRSRRHDRHRILGRLRGLRHAVPAGGHGGPGAGHPDGLATGNPTSEIVARLDAARRDLGGLAVLPDEQLEQVPATDSFRFCNGERTLEQVLAGLLKHQGHQVQVLAAALNLPR